MPYLISDTAVDVAYNSHLTRQRPPTGLYGIQNFYRDHTVEQEEPPEGHELLYCCLGRFGFDQKSQVSKPLLKGQKC